MLALMADRLRFSFQIRPIRSRRCMFPDISLVTALCSSTATAVDVTYS